MAVQLALIRAAGEPTTLAEVIPKPVPDSRNAAVLYQQVLATGPERSDRQGPPGFADIADWSVMPDYLEKPHDAALRAAAWKVLADPETRRRLDIIRQASLRPDCVILPEWPGRVLQSPWRFTPFRHAAYWLAGNAQMLSSQRHPDQALVWVRVGLRMSQHVAAMSSPQLLGEMQASRARATLLDAAEEALRDSTPSAEALSQTLRTASTVDPYASFETEPCSAIASARYRRSVIP